MKLTRQMMTLGAVFLIAIACSKKNDEQQPAPEAAVQRNHNRFGEVSCARSFCSCQLDAMSYAVLTLHRLDDDNGAATPVQVINRFTAWGGCFAALDADFRCVQRNVCNWPEQQYCQCQIETIQSWANLILYIGGRRISTLESYTSVGGCQARIATHPACRQF